MHTRYDAMDGGLHPEVSSVLRLKQLASLVLPFVITVTYFRHANQAAGSRAFALRRIMSFAKSSRVKVHWNGAADLS